MFGTVSQFNRLKGYGFIVSDEPTLPDFFTCSKFIEAEKHRRFFLPGQRVEFTPIDADTDHPIAKPVRIVGSFTIARQISEDVKHDPALRRATTPPIAPGGQS